MTDELRRHLTELPDLYAHLAGFVAAGARPADPDARLTGGPSSRPTADLGVLDLLDTREKPDSDVARTDYDLDRRAGARRKGVLPTLVAWCRTVDCDLTEQLVEHPLPPEPATVAGACGYLLRYLDWTTHQPWAGELAAEVATMHADVRAAIGERDPITMVCTDCGWPVRQVEHKGALPTYHCIGCERVWSQLELHHIAKRLRPMSLQEIALTIGRPVKTLHEWTSPKKRLLKPVGRDHRGRLYLYEDAIRVALSFASGRKTGRDA